MMLAKRQVGEISSSAHCRGRRIDAPQKISGSVFAGICDGPVAREAGDRLEARRGAVQHLRPRGEGQVEGRGRASGPVRVLQHSASCSQVLIANNLASKVFSAGEVGRKGLNSTEVAYLLLTQQPWDQNFGIPKRG